MCCKTIRNIEFPTRAQQFKTEKEHKVQVEKK